MAQIFTYFWVEQIPINIYFAYFRCHNEEHRPLTVEAQIVCVAKICINVSQGV